MIKEYYQTWKNENGDVVVVVVTLFDDVANIIGRGVSVCSPGDEPEEVVGSVTAYNYALHALKGRGNILITDPRAGKVLSEIGCPYILHSIKTEQISWAEARCFFGDDIKLQQKGNANGRWFW